MEGDGSRNIPKLCLIVVEVILILIPGKILIRDGLILDSIFIARQEFL